jgi:lipoyl(octanoyl) transferase
VIEVQICIPSQYEKCLEFQRKLNKMRNDDIIPDTIIVTEHEDTYTAGIHFNNENEKNYSVPIIKVERGGALTYHGRGQIVFYFIFKLNERGFNVKDLILRIQDSMNLTLSDYGLKSEGRLFKETGVWTNGKKICSIGLALKGFSTLHGIAVNVNTDLSKFSYINPCDFDPNIMTSIEHEIGRKVQTEEFIKKFLDNFSSVISDKIEIRECQINK